MGTTGALIILGVTIVGIVVLCVLAALMYYGVAYLEKRFAHWRAHA